ncbi:MAG: BatA domain-containing protein [Gemmatimonadaceae bacterium]
MIWRNPWAWAGLAALALPVLIHLLARGRARVHPFPTLRFLEPSRLLPTRRTRVHDVVLLLVRLGILAAAVAALAQPALRTAERRGAVGRALARAIVVDTSASLRRQTPAGEQGVEAARRGARRLAGEAGASVVLESSAPSGAIAGAMAWLSRQAGRGEVVIISDFQVGALEARDLALVPPTVGVRLERVDVLPMKDTLETYTRYGDSVLIARTAFSEGRATVEWSAGRAPARGGDTLLLLAGAGERARADADARAAASVGIPVPEDTAHAVAIVYPGFERRGELLRGATPPRAPWMTDAVARLRSDSMLLAAAARAPVSDEAARAPGLVIARDDGGRPVMVAAQDTAAGRERLLLFSSADAGSLAATALIAAAARARSLAPPITELEPATLPAPVLAPWQRAPAADPPAGANADGAAAPSDGRWLWVLTLALLALETWLRRSAHEPTAARVAHDRAA